MNLPNKLTLLRVAMIPACLALIAANAYIPAAIVFFLACVTDYLDGHIARSRGIVTVFGKFADPVADKMLVLTVMILLCARGGLPAWAVCVVAARDLMVDGLRMVAGGKGQVVAAGMLGKLKTNAQFACVLSALLLTNHWLTTALCVLMAALTVVSGAQYFYACRAVFADDKP
jgi:CDP-diacylglycerol---glycerol-3-phosphate 3-phosphatidyltransferase